MAACSAQFFVCAAFLFCLSSAQPSFRPKALVLPVTKDASTNQIQYVTKINQRTPLVPLNLVVDLGGRYLWVDCDNNYVSSTFRPVSCRTSQCSLAESRACGQCSFRPTTDCNRSACIVSPNNFVTRTSTDDQVAEDVVSVQSTNGFSSGPSVRVPRFIFSCAPTSLVQGLAGGASGVAGLGRNRVALPSQFASAFSFDRKLAICLPSSTSSPGVIFFGDGPYNFIPNVDASTSLVYTPLLTNPVSTAPTFFLGDRSYEYFIGVRSIKVNGKAVPLNSTLLSISEDGRGGTKFSTADPFTVMESSIFRAFRDAFVSGAAALNISTVTPVAPFDVCFNRFSVPSSRVGPSIASIDLVLQNENVVFPITGRNSLFSVGDKLCLAFVDGGSEPTTSIVIGAHQLEDYLVQFDLATSRIGFTSLVGRQTICSNFNFTSTS